MNRVYDGARVNFAGAGRQQKKPSASLRTAFLTG
jgi:hypothetical protein